MDTSASLLESLRQATNDEAWNRLVDLYSPLIHGWLRRHGAAEGDVDDVAQEVLTVLVRRLPEFRREPRKGAFRTWLRTITANCLRDHWRRKNKQPAAVGGTDFAAIIDQLEDPLSGLSKMWDREHDKHVTQYLLHRIRPEFSEQTWRSFQRFVLDGMSANAVAKELGVSPNSVFIAKSRIMSRMRQLGQGLID